MTEAVKKTLKTLSCNLIYAFKPLTPNNCESSKWVCIRILIFFSIIAAIDRYLEIPDGALDVTSGRALSPLPLHEIGP